MAINIELRKAISGALKTDIQLSKQQKEKYKKAMDELIRISCALPPPAFVKQPVQAESTQTFSASAI